MIEFRILFYKGQCAFVFVIMLLNFTFFFPYEHCGKEYKQTSVDIC